MFDYAQQRALEVLGTPRTAVLVTNGPAGIQIGEFACTLSGLSLYLLVPQTSDHLFNLEHDATVALLINRCEVKGRAQIIPRATVEPDCALVQESEVDWCAFLRVEISQVQLRSEAGWGNRETIDLEVPIKVAPPAGCAL
jgi:hypothetical protein